MLNDAGIVGAAMHGHPESSGYIRGGTAAGEAAAGEAG
jgi:hypothetical protein